MYSGDVSNRNNFGTFSSVSKLSWSSASSSFSVFRWRWLKGIAFNIHVRHYSFPCHILSCRSLLLLLCHFDFSMRIRLRAARHKMGKNFCLLQQKIESLCLSRFVFNAGGCRWGIILENKYFIISRLNTDRFILSIQHSLDSIDKKKPTTKKTRKSMFEIWQCCKSGTHLCVHFTTFPFNSPIPHFVHQHRPYLRLTLWKIDCNKSFLFSKVQLPSKNYDISRVIFRKQRDEAKQKSAFCICMQWRCS